MTPTITRISSGHAGILNTLPFHLDYGSFSLPGLHQNVIFHKAQGFLSVLFAATFTVPISTWRTLIVKRCRQEQEPLLDTPAAPLGKVSSEFAAPSLS